jgi:hypothetical protein
LRLGEDEAKVIHRREENVKEQNFDLEAVYDAQIAPLMDQIIRICSDHKMPVFATFQYRSDVEGTDDGEDRFCTTNLMFQKERPTNETLRSLGPMMRRRTGFLAVTITNSSHK